MLRIHFTGEDLARVRISTGPQPMWESLLSLYRLRRPDGGVIFDGWRRAIRPKALATTRLLTDLVPSSGYAVVFLTPMTRELSLADGLEALRRTPKKRLAKDLSVLAAERRLQSWTAPLADGQRDAVTRLPDSVERYFAACLAPYWTQIRAGVDHERARHGRLMTEGGCEYLLERIHPTARWRYPVLELGYPVTRDLRLRGRGLLLVPSFFCWGMPTAFFDDFEPALVYPIEHTVGWSARQPAGHGLSTLLGRTRARVLEAIGDRPGTTSELARRTATTLPTTSQQAANSSNNQITNNHFDYLENSPVNDLHLHGTYVTHFSSHNNISDSRFTHQNGDPVKVRDRSNYNTVDRNVFTRSGTYGFYRDEICDKACVLANPDEVDARQCASYGSKFRYNRLISDYDGDNSSEAWTLKPPGLTYTGSAPCTIPAGEQRLYTAGNTTS